MLLCSGNSFRDLMREISRYFQCWLDSVHNASPIKATAFSEPRSRCTTLSVLPAGSMAASGYHLNKVEPSATERAVLLHVQYFEFEKTANGKRQKRCATWEHPIMFTIAEPLAAGTDLHAIARQVQSENSAVVKDVALPQVERALHVLQQRDLAQPVAAGTLAALYLARVWLWFITETVSAAKQTQVCRCTRAQLEARRLRVVPSPWTGRPGGASSHQVAFLQASLRGKVAEWRDARHSPCVPPSESCATQAKVR